MTHAITPHGVRWRAVVNVPGRMCCATWCGTADEVWEWCEAVMREMGGE